MAHRWVDLPQDGPIYKTNTGLVLPQRNWQTRALYFDGSYVSTRQDEWLDTPDTEPWPDEEDMTWTVEPTPWNQDLQPIKPCLKVGVKERPPIVAEDQGDSTDLDLEEAGTWDRAYRVDSELVETYLALVSGTMHPREQKEKEVELKGRYLLFKGKVVVPDSLIDTLIQQTHNSKYLGHLGVTRTVLRLKRHFVFPDMTSRARTIIGRCYKCQAVKPRHGKPQGELQPLDLPDTRWTHLSLDWMGPFPLTKRKFDTILVIMDRLTKRGHFIPTRSDATVGDLKDLFINNIVKIHGTPQQLVSDRDKLLTAGSWVEFLDWLQTQSCKTVAGRPQADGAVERVNYTVQNLLRTLQLENPEEWDSLLPFVEIQYNRVIDPRTGHSPFLLDLGYEPYFPDEVPDLIREERTVRQTNQRQEAYLKEARRIFEVSRGKMKSRHDQRTEPFFPLQGGQYVWLLVHRAGSKLEPKATGPWKVLKFTESNVTLEIPGFHGHPVFNRSSIRKYTPAPNSPRPYLPYPTSYLGIRGILEDRQGSVQREYLVKWHDHERETWEPRDRFRRKDGGFAPVLLQYEQRQAAEQSKHDHYAKTGQVVYEAILQDPSFGEVEQENSVEQDIPVENIYSEPIARRTRSSNVVHDVAANTAEGLVLPRAELAGEVPLASGPEVETPMELNGINTPSSTLYNLFSNWIAPRSQAMT